MPDLHQHPSLASAAAGVWDASLDFHGWPTTVHTLQASSFSCVLAHLQPHSHHQTPCLVLTHGKTLQPQDCTLTATDPTVASAPTLSTNPWCLSCPYHHVCFWNQHLSRHRHRQWFPQPRCTHQRLQSPTLPSLVQSLATAPGHDTEESTTFLCPHGAHHGVTDTMPHHQDPELP